MPKSFQTPLLKTLPDDFAKARVVRLVRSVAMPVLRVEEIGARLGLTINVLKKILQHKISIRAA